MEITEPQINMLQAPLPSWAVKPHPVKKNMSAIHPMAIIDRLNEVFGQGGWNFTTEFISCDKEQQQVKEYKDGKPTGNMKTRDVYVSAVKGRLEIGELTLEQYGGSTNDDKGDALKGGATDALTKISSYLGIGAEIYKGHGNITPGDDLVNGYSQEVDGQIINVRR